MRKRFGEETKYIWKADTSVVAIEEWIEKIFKQEGTEDFRFPEETWQWLKETVLEQYVKADSDRIRRMILLKVIHTREVVRAGFDIIQGDSGEDWNIEQVGAVCLLHDIARFEQSLLGSFSDTKTNFDHAVIGAKMIRKKKFVDCGVDIECVADAVESHSAFAYKGGERYAKLVRDADKLALLRSMPEILELEIGGFLKDGVTKEALDSFRKGEIVKRKDMRTMTDLFLAWLVWETDMNFPQTIKCFYDEGIKVWMVEEVKKRGVEI